MPAHSPPSVSDQQKPVEIIRAYQKYPEAPAEKQPEPVKGDNKPRVLEPLKNLDLVEGGKVVFECRFQGSPLNIQWFKGDRELKNQYRHKMVYDENTGRARLIISTVLEEDADVYTCRASNSLGDAITSAKLLSHGKQKQNKKDLKIKLIKIALKIPRTLKIPYLINENLKYRKFLSSQIDASSLNSFKALIEKIIPQKCLL